MPNDVVRTKNNRLMAKAIHPTCGTKLNTFVSDQEGAGLLSMLGINLPFIKNIPILGSILG